MSGSRTDRRAAREPPANKKINVLKSATGMAWSFQTWRTDAENDFKTRDLYGYLTGAIDSKFNEDHPTFDWVMDVVTITAAPGGGQARGDSKPVVLGFDGEDSGERGSEDGDSEEEVVFGGTPTAAPDTTPSEHTETPLTEPFPKSSKSSRAATTPTPAGFVRSVRRFSPQTSGLRMGSELMLAPTAEFYFSRLDSHKRDVEGRSKRKALLGEKIDAGMELIKSLLSAAVQHEIEDVLATRDLYDSGPVCNPSVDRERVTKASPPESWSGATPR
ncbi:hypothetical protein B484DRAFT_462045 [Ochromonadaceae sp. CCMP2298]|nr:hypothetical protein B484DRAFT_462045 [Ochromonadaceae sp. CCMP2298]